MNKVYRISILFFALVLSSLGLQAQIVSEEDAADIARSFLQRQHQKSGQMNAAPGRVEVRCAYVSEDAGQSDFYIFNEANRQGFVIVSGVGDDAPILGYSTHGTFHIDSIPANLRWWLGQYQQQIRQAKRQQRQAPAVTTPADASRVISQMHRAPKRTSVPDMIKTRWDQDEPFNSAIPSLGPGYTGQYALATGCGPTATSQIMKYYNHPLHGVGSHSFVINWNGDNPVTYSADFANTTYDWDNMLDSYGQGYTQQQADAVANLLYHVSVAEDTQYGQIISGGSATSSMAPAIALTTYFDYDKSISHELRSYYSDEDWEMMIYDELQAGRPVFYAGQSADGGHAFVCHGYDADLQMYAFNWGWSGYCDGYYRISGTPSLDPNGHGIGGSESNDSYAMDQEVIIGIQPNVGGDYRLQIASFDKYTMTKDYGSALDSYVVDRSKGEDADLSLNIQYYNIGMASATFDAGILLRCLETGSEYYLESESDYQLGSTQYYTFPSHLHFSTLKLTYAGTYQVIPTYRKAGEGWKKVYFEQSQTIPTIVIKNCPAEAPTEVNFELTATKVQVGNTITVLHDQYYTGAITYSSSDPSVATVSADGIITGVSEGNAVITVIGEADERYVATTRQFSIQVLGILKSPLELAATAHELQVGESTRLLLPQGYTGTCEMELSADGILRLESDGSLTALAPGQVTLYVKSSETDVYDESLNALTFNVSEVPASTGNLDFCTMPYVGNDNIATKNDFVAHLRVRNNSGAGITNAVVYYSIESEQYIHSGYSGYQYMENEAEHDITIDYGKYAKYFDEGKRYRFQFYLDEGHTMPMNVPSVTFVLSRLGGVTYVQEPNSYGTLCLPVDAALPVNLKAYETSTLSNGSLVLKEVSAIKRNRPVILSGTAGSYTFNNVPTDALGNPTYGLLTGVLTSTSLPQGAYMLRPQSDLGFFQAQDGTAPEKYSAYITLPTLAEHPQCLSLPSLGGETTPLMDPSIDGVKTVSGIYSPDGKRLGQLSLGVNIIRYTDGSVIKVMK